MRAQQTSPQVDTYVKTAKRWKDEIQALRQIVLDCHLDENLKWRLPCYSHNGKNIAIIQSFKDSCALMFFKGFALKDPKRLLKRPGENSQTGRRLEFTSIQEISKRKAAIKAFIKEAIKAEEADVKLDKKVARPPQVPAEFQKELARNKKLKTAFENLTPGRQRHYLMHFSSAKQSETRSARIEKCTPRILKGLGLND